jgi:predicted enzyme related to lactoylglutathione lyase
VGEREQYEPGTFCWADLGTNDPDAATAFYVGLFGWDIDDTPMGDAGVYRTFRLDGGSVCALYRRENTEGPSGPLSGVAGPPAWLCYVSVADADAAAEAARAAGAAGVQAPFDVFDAGRMTVVEDPTGAHVAVWQPGTSIGATLVNVPGAFCLNQLNTSDPERAAAFYTDAFGWRIDQVGTEPMPYWGIWNGPGLNGGMMRLPEGSPAPAHWLLYFASDDLDGAVTQVGQLGGTVLVPPMAVPGGRISVASDPQGATFGLLEGRLDP